NLLIELERGLALAVEGQIGVDLHGLLHGVIGRSSIGTRHGYDEPLRFGATVITFWRSSACNAGALGEEIIGQPVQAFAPAAYRPGVRLRRLTLLPRPCFFSFACSSLK